MVSLSSPDTAHSCHHAGLLAAVMTLLLGIAHCRIRDG